MPAVTANGLTTAEAVGRRAEHGPNRLLTHFFAAMLWVAGALALIAGLPTLGIAIFAVILLNALFAFAQQTRADHAAERLRAMLPAQVSVWRDGRRQIIEAEDVVVDDGLLLENGDRVPADAVVTAANRLLVDSSMLTGKAWRERSATARSSTRGRSSSKGGPRRRDRDGRADAAGDHRETRHIVGETGHPAGA